MLNISPPNAGSPDGVQTPLTGASSIAVLIVGMHRSGTSALSGMLNKLGVAVPEDLLPADEHNTRGYFESRRIVEFHDRLLSRLGSPWNDPLSLTYDWVDSPVGRAAADELADILDEEFGGEPMRLFKDPRICRLAPIWIAALARSGRGTAVILPYRNPLQVAGSLLAREGVGRASSLFLWIQHVLLGERFTRGLPRSFASYDELMADWRTVAVKLKDDLGVSWPRDLARAAPDVDAFLSRELHHQKESSEALNAQEPLAGLCLRAWQALQRLGRDAYDSEAMATFDALRTELDVGFGVFAPLIIEHQRTLAAVSADRDAAAADRDIAAAQRTWWSDQFDELSRQHGAATHRVAQQDELIRQRDTELAEIRLQHAEAAAHAAKLQLKLQASDSEVARLQQIEASTFWALSWPLRRALEKFPLARKLGRSTAQLAWWTVTFQLFSRMRKRARTAGAPIVRPPVAGPSSSGQPSSLGSAVAAIERAVGPRILFVSGESNTPGHQYRVVRFAQAAARTGARPTITTTEEIADKLHLVSQADAIFIWRAAWDGAVEALLKKARECCVPVVFDADDLMFDPSIARSEVIDGIRSQGFDEGLVAEFYGRVRQVIERADVCTAPTPFLAQQMRQLDKPSYVLPNGFDEDVLRRSRLAARKRRAAPSDGLLRIGYATGSRTHQRDFAQCAEAVAAVLRERPDVRLVLFESNGVPVLDTAEFPAFAGLEAQIEWRGLVPIQQLPDELARFDISIAPVEVGNPFCEAKSELKYFESALVDVPTIASPTEPFRLAIRADETGFLAQDTRSWRDALMRLLGDAELRRTTAKAAFFHALAEFGPERRSEAFQSLLDQLLGSPRRAARTLENELLRQGRAKAPLPHVPPHEVVFERDRLESADVTVIIPLYNYANYVVEALESVSAQTERKIDLVVVDDASTDQSLATAREWIERNAERFNRVMLIRNLQNSGLGFSRNVGFANAETLYVLPLDADNRLRPAFVERTLAEIEASSAAFVYPRIRKFGDQNDEIGFHAWSPSRLINGNYIDAMALVRRSAWAAVGGYDHVRFGWEDYDFWCRLVERGMFGAHVPETLADYRAHGGSMLRTETEVLRNKLRLIDDMERRHPWLRLERSELPSAASQSAPQPARAPPASDSNSARLDRILPVLRCPRTGKPLVLDGEVLRAEDGDVAWPLVAGRPVLFEGLGEPRVFPDEHISNPLPERAIELIEQTPGLVLNLSAGGTARRYDHVIEAEFAVFRNTDVIADAHALPFADETFDLVVSMNAFEHYHSPRQAADEILRVLKPGGRVLVRTAFLQPLHEAPWHFYNCTRYGLERWFERFETQDMQVSDNFNPVHAITWQLSEAEQLLARELSAADAQRFANASAKELIALWRDPATRGSPLWRRFFDLPPEAQEGLAAGFEYLGRKPS